MFRRSGATTFAMRASTAPSRCRRWKPGRRRSAKTHHRTRLQDLTRTHRSGEDGRFRGGNRRIRTDQMRSCRHSAGIIRRMRLKWIRCLRQTGRKSDRTLTMSDSYHMLSFNSCTHFSRLRVLFSDWSSLPQVKSKNLFPSSIVDNLCLILSRCHYKKVLSG